MHLYRLLILCCLLFVGCEPLDPLGGDTGYGTDPFGNPVKEIDADTWVLKFVSRQQVAYADIDNKYLDGRLPETVNYEMEGDDISRHRVLEWGHLQLRDNGFFRLLLQYNRYTVRPGEDIGPTAACRADVRGAYGVRGGTLILYPDRLLNDHITLQLDDSGSLRGIQLPNTCSGLDAGAEFESDILLQNVVFGVAK